ncbi:fibrous sheath-interacting protein 1 isoform X1 [Takifugu flavidus]|uniref:fibrous sheath-interacting protein 1 isoform X1 n=1 Tax=Takifugu flavidus TaxID=433684 RepID=UPI002544484F|nr:fibrous sheath-interacting protein 1 isoform X1 [Takifugu flavidus]
MELAKESLDDIYGPSGTQHTGDDAVSGVTYPPRTSAAPVTGADSQDPSRPDVTETVSAAGGPDKGQRHEDLELQRAMEEMKQLDEILLKMICREREIKRQRKEFQARLWQAFLQNKPEDHSECTSEAVNTRLFLALETLTATDEEQNFVPVFTTQVPECEHSRDRTPEQSEKRSGSCGSFEADVEEPGEKQFGGSHSGTSKSKKRQKDFVNRNIEMVCGRKDAVSRAERQRLAELLQEIDEEEDAASRGADSEGDLWAESALTGQGYTPQPSDLEQLTAIDCKIHLLLPVRDVLSVRDPPTGPELTQDCLPEADWSCDGDLRPGERVLQDIKEWSRLERRLQEIQQQLETLSWSQEMTSEPPDLTEEQLRGLLDECEQDYWIQDLETDESL